MVNNTIAWFYGSVPSEDVTKPGDAAHRDWTPVRIRFKRCDLLTADAHEQSCRAFAALSFCPPPLVGGRTLARSQLRKHILVVVWHDVAAVPTAKLLLRLCAG